MKSNCLLYAIKYRLTHKKSKIKACWDDKLKFYHFFIIHDNFEIHCEQKNSNDKWAFLFEYKVVKIKLRNKYK